MPPLPKHVLIVLLNNKGCLGAWKLYLLNYLLRNLESFLTNSFQFYLDIFCPFFPAESFSWPLNCIIRAASCKQLYSEFETGS